MSMEDQIVLVDKPAGISSFGVVAKIRRELRDEFGHKVKVGHTGTLDPFATGLLILLSGKMTKKSGEFLKLDKVYEATMKLGYVSTTGDTEGDIQEYLNSGPRPSGPFAYGNSRPKGRAPRAAGAKSRAAALRNAPRRYLFSCYPLLEIFEIFFSRHFTIWCFKFLDWRYTSTNRNFTTDNDIFLKTTEMIYATIDSCVNEYSRSILEGCC